MNMNQLSETPTIRFYDDNAAEYIRSTSDLNMQMLYEPFLRQIPHGGRILDAGCGSGRDSKAFADRGYSVVSIDASQKMVDATSELTGQLAICMAFQQIALTEEFDGVWACASLLHVPLSELTDVLFRLTSALRPSGVLYASFKNGHVERHQDGRLFTDMDERNINRLVAGISRLEIIQCWRTEDLRPNQSDEWLNVLLKKTPIGLKRQE